MILSRFKCILLAITVSFLSCNKEEEEFQTPVINFPDQGDSDSEGDHSVGDANYYFRVETQIGNIWPEAGKTIISIDCNQSWTASYDGNINGFLFSPSHGNGRSHMTISYDEAIYKKSYGDIYWKENGIIT